NAWTESQAVPYVSVIAPDAKARRISIDLPGRLEAYAQAQLFARVSGYLQDRHVDMGASVKAGQLLAEIDAPDLDQQI
ncbi:biotin/lipoyl-binding protein, partial [Acinetobacter baumannii]